MGMPINIITMLTGKWSEKDVDGGQFYHYALYKLASADIRTHLLDCGNRFNPHLLTKVLRMEHADLRDVLRHVMIARIFTIHQLVQKLERIFSKQINYLVVADIDRLFKDSSIPAYEMENGVKRVADLLSSLDYPVCISVNKAIYLNKRAKEVTTWEGQYYLQPR